MSASQDLKGQDLKGRAWLVLGASSPVARAFARVVAARGADVILAGRDQTDLSATATDIGLRSGVRTHVIGFDALDMEGHADAAKEAADKAAEWGDGLDVFLAFGLMPEQALSEAEPGWAISAIGATYTGAVTILLHLANLMEKAGSGRVVVIGSVAGDRGRLKNYVYGSAKAGLAAFASGLRARLWRKGVTLTLIKPGFLDTAMTWGAPGIFLAASPEQAATAMLAASLKGKEVAYVPRFWELIMLIIRNIPERIFKKLSI